MKELRTSKINPDTGDVEATYSKELILDGVTAFMAMRDWMDIYFKDNKDMELGELISHLYFNGSNYVDRTECWTLWEKVIKEAIKKRG